jgi:hypothetical protein
MARRMLCTSKTIQNEIIDIVGRFIRNDLTSCLNEDDAFFAIMADELTDQHTNQEVLTVCLRFVDMLDDVYSVKEVFFDFSFLEHTSGEKIAEGIIQSLKKYGVDILKCRSHAYDGAACMSSEAVGVQGRITRISPRALYTHCKSHVLNLSIASSCKDPPIRNMIDQVNETFLFFDNSGKRQRFFEHVLEKRNSSSISSKQKLLGLCKTCWVERHTCYDTLYELFEHVCICLDAILNPKDERFQDLYVAPWDKVFWDRDTRIKTQGLLSTLTSFQFIVAFLSAKDMLEVVKGIASKLQKSDLDAYEAYSMIDSCHERFQRYRENVEREFHETFEKAASLCEKVGGTVCKPRTVTRQAHRGNIPGDSPESYYRKNLQIPLLDHLVSEMRSRFDKEGRTCADIFILVPAVVVKLDYDELVGQALEKLLFWQDDLPTPTSLKSELKEWKHYWETREDVPKNLVNCLNQTDRDMFPNIHVLLRIGCTLPVGSAGAERFRRTKTYLRNKMGEERLSGLCLMNIHKDIEIDINKVLLEFISKFKRRMLLAPILYDE